MKFNLPKGSKALVMKNQFEKEAVLKPGAEFTVDKIDKPSHYGPTIIQCMYHPDGVTKSGAVKIHVANAKVPPPEDNYSRVNNDDWEMVPVEKSN